MVIILNLKGFPPYKIQTQEGELWVLSVPGWWNCIQFAAGQPSYVLNTGHFKSLSWVSRGCFNVLCLLQNCEILKNI